MKPKSTVGTFIGIWLVCAAMVICGVLAIVGESKESVRNVLWFCTLASGMYGLNAAAKFFRFSNHSLRVDGHLLIVFDRTGGEVCRAPISEFRACNMFFGTRQPIPDSETTIRLVGKSVAMVGLLTLENQKQLMQAWPVKAKVVSASLGEARLHAVVFGAVALFFLYNAGEMVKLGNKALAVSYACGIILALMGMRRILQYASVASRKYDIDGQLLRVVAANKEPVSIDLAQAKRTYFDLANREIEEPSSQYGLTLLSAGSARVQVPSGLLSGLESDASETRSP